MKKFLFYLDIPKLIDQAISSNAVLRGIKQLTEKKNEAKHLFSIVETDGGKSCANSPFQVRKKPSLCRNELLLQGERKSSSPPLSERRGNLSHRDSEESNKENISFSGSKLQVNITFMFACITVIAMEMLIKYCMNSFLQVDQSM